MSTAHRASLVRAVNVTLLCVILFGCSSLGPDSTEEQSLTPESPLAIPASVVEGRPILFLSSVMEVGQSVTVNLSPAEGQSGTARRLTVVPLSDGSASLPHGLAPGRYSASIAGGAGGTVEFSVVPRQLTPTDEERSCHPEAFECATPLVPGQSVIGTWATPHDTDFFSFVALEGTRFDIRLRVEPEHRNFYPAKPELFVFDPDGLAVLDGAYAFGHKGPAQLTGFVASQTGRHIIACRGIRGRGQYQLSISRPSGTSSLGFPEFMSARAGPTVVNVSSAKKRPPPFWLAAFVFSKEGDLVSGQPVRWESPGHSIRGQRSMPSDSHGVAKTWIELRSGSNTTLTPVTPEAHQGHVSRQGPFAGSVTVGPGGRILDSWLPTRAELRETAQAAIRRNQFAGIEAPNSATPCAPMVQVLQLLGVEDLHEAEGLTMRVLGDPQGPGAVSDAAIYEVPLGLDVLISADQGQEKESGDRQESPVDPAPHLPGEGNRPEYSPPVAGTSTPIVVEVTGQMGNSGLGDLAVAVLSSADHNRESVISLDDNGRGSADIHPGLWAMFSHINAFDRPEYEVSGVVTARVDIWSEEDRDWVSLIDRDLLRARPAEVSRLAWLGPPDLASACFESQSGDGTHICSGPPFALVDGFGNLITASVGSDTPTKGDSANLTTEHLGGTPGVLEFGSDPFARPETITPWMRVSDASSPGQSARWRICPQTSSGRAGECGELQLPTVINEPHVIIVRNGTELSGGPVHLGTVEPGSALGTEDRGLTRIQILVRRPADIELASEQPNLTVRITGPVDAGSSFFESPEAPWKQLEPVPRDDVVFCLESTGEESCVESGLAQLEFPLSPVGRSMGPPGSRWVATPEFSLARSPKLPGHYWLTVSAEPGHFPFLDDWIGHRQVGWLDTDSGVYVNAELRVVEGTIITNRPRTVWFRGVLESTETRLPITMSFTPDKNPETKQSFLVAGRRIGPPAGNQGLYVGSLNLIPGSLSEDPPAELRENVLDESRSPGLEISAALASSWYWAEEIDGLPAGLLSGYDQSVILNGLRLSVNISLFTGASGAMEFVRNTRLESLEPYHRGIPDESKGECPADECWWRSPYEEVGEIVLARVGNRVLSVAAVSAAPPESRHEILHQVLTALATD